MRAETEPTRGVAYFGYANGRKWLARQDEAGLRRYLNFHGIDIGEGQDIALKADSVFSSIFMYPGAGREERTVSRWAINVGHETFFDRFPEAIDIFDAMSEAVEDDVSGYVADEPGGMDWCTSLTHAFADLSVAVAVLKEPKELWWARRALDEAYIDKSINSYVGALLENELKRLKIDDDGQSPWRAIGDERGFLSPEDFKDFWKREESFKTRRELARSAFQKYVQKPGVLFDLEKARAAFEESGGASAIYFEEDLIEGQLREREAVAQLKEMRKKYGISSDGTTGKIPDELRPPSDAAIERYRSFSRDELEAGYSPYGYWFDPEGTYYPMREFQGHAKWLKKHFSVEYGDDMYTAYRRAWSQGWVLMSMGEDLPGVMIRYAEDDVSPEAIRAAAKMLRRGGMFPLVMIEPHDREANATGYQRFDKAGAAAEHLKQLAKEMENSRDSGPRM